ncbi:UNVERIFIED_ORG: dihydrodipicolinate synthase/N-acetylneuraminate lyase [Heyndrickxia coagulans]
MTTEERMEITKFTVSYVNGRVPVLIGTGSTSTRMSVLLSQHAEQCGADGVLVVNPYYWSLSEDNLSKHYGTIAESVNIPILLYNFPTLTGQDLSPDFVLKLVDHYENIVGIKETTDQAGHIREMILKVKNKHPHFSVFAGFDDHLLNTLALGGDGAIGSSFNFAPELGVGIFEAFKNNDLERAVRLHKQLAYLPLIYKLDTPFINVVKEAVKLRGVDIDTSVLPPVYRLEEEKIDQLKELLRQAQLLN